MRFQLAFVVISLIAGVVGCSQEPITGKSSSGPKHTAIEATKPAVKVAPVRRVAETKSSSTSRTTELTMPSGLGLDMPSTNSFSDGVNSINPVQMQPAGGVPGYNPIVPGK